jgi:hypothetical protein
VSLVTIGLNQERPSYASFTMSDLGAFGWAFVGSVAHEVVLFSGHVRTRKDRRFPALYRNAAFLIARLLLAMVAGVVAAAWGINLPIEAFAIGVAAPRIVLSFGRMR